MEEETKLTCCHGKATTCLACSRDEPSQLWHSTPVKKRDDGWTRFRADWTAPRGPAGARFDTGTPNYSEVPLTEPRVFSTLQRQGAEPSSSASTLQRQGAEPSSSASTLQRQRAELQLLVSELKDRERELNAMTASHHRERRCWERDRRRAEALERRGVQVEEELQKRSEVIQVLASRLCAVELREEEQQQELRQARQQLEELQKDLQLSLETRLHLQEENRRLSSSVTDLSTQLGSLQVRQEELRSVLQLKDRDVSEAAVQNRDLSERLQRLRSSLEENRRQEDRLLTESQENRRLCREAAAEAALLREELQQQVTQSSSQREEIIRLKQELQLLNRQLNEGGDSWKDELLQLARSKQERLTSELDHLRQVCEEQQDDLQQLRRGERSAGELLSSQDEPDHRPPPPLAVRSHRDPSSLTGALRGPGRRRQADVQPDAALANQTWRTVSAAPGCSLLDESRLFATGPDGGVTLDPRRPPPTAPSLKCGAPP
ncbi:coiled-coil domain-containing protein 62 isoform X2 [Salarias fasciatus]|uniref:coiled-coil domain-containing protein 62 isoform X2 n=1 Tax=Salarias fasciatus TaxID=181472 RepID=UPI001176D613|nr:coiled-coil domain-containing protein 62 isoform X2 [Salarias fasciatus]